MLQQILFITTMEKPIWHKIEKNSSKPCPRWGHTCCVIDDEVIFFGGYADSNYMNDLWTYHATERKWQEVPTTGQRPSHRSNCTINYDPFTNQVVVFGGGGPNKQRFNSVSLLDWNTKVWRQVTPKQNQPSPWERTYHVAQLRYPYLVVFGGEGLADMDDLWLFDFRNQRWSEVKMDKDAVRPCARRFHSSCLIGNEFFVIAGCHSKYRCLSDVFSLDLTPLLASNTTKDLKWVERKLKGASFLSRWGHSSAVYDGKIYVFAGRFSNDLNDLLVIDVSSNVLKGLKIGSSSDLPKPRRRHCAGFVGSCMIAFGGFNGEYFNDLYYINVFELTNRLQNSNEQALSKHVGNTQTADQMIMTEEGEAFPIHRGLIARYFKSEADFNNYLTAINHKYPKEQLTSLLQVLYRGYGKTDDSLLQQHNVNLPQNLNRRTLLNTLLQEQPNERNLLALAHQSTEKSTEWYVGLRRQEFERFIEKRRSHWYADGAVEMGCSRINVNKTLLSLQSTYFNALLSGRYCQDGVVRLSLEKTYSPVVLDIILNSLMLGALVVPQDYSLQGWVELSELADYFCLTQLRSVCEVQLCNKVTPHNSRALETFADSMGMNNLGMHCANQQLKCAEEQVCSGWVQKLKQLMRFELSHSTWKQQGKIPGLKKKGESQSAIEEKENNRECSNL